MSPHVRRRAVGIPNRDGLVMYGVLTGPQDEAGNGSAIVLCHAGVTSKAGTGEYLRLLAEDLAERGYVVLRFDQTGVGDSQGDLPDGVPIDAYYRRVQGGLFVADTEAAIDWVRREVQPRALYLFGHCGGGITASLVAAKEPEAFAGVISVALPVLLSQSNDDAMRAQDAGAADRPLLAKLARRLGRALRILVRGLGSADTAAPRRRAARAALDPRLHERFNHALHEAFTRLMDHGVPVLLLMASLDNETPEFDREFKALLQARPDWAGRWHAVYLPDTDHSVMFEASRACLTNAIVAGIPRMAGDVTAQGGTR
jgi:alpha-beta hydrolase superfamily lysophospholipase